MCTHIMLLWVLLHINDVAFVRGFVCRSKTRPEVQCLRENDVTMAICASSNCTSQHCSVLYYAIPYLCLCVRDVYHEEQRGVESHRVDQPNLSRSQTRTERKEVT